jgi:hypothetical protein
MNRAPVENDVDCFSVGRVRHRHSIGLAMASRKPRPGRAALGQ